ncbi:hypothetical protein NQ315_003673 [Exocentrus adspersus]|uniref:C-CAP/cofactor C-like domain-containing protein n=1 Tax=Exocentrus adspersus TaxID=1586481 RepID=A0AAV8V9U7_9CUCU|nr:hypothetical protein NQ315_003673 [Exocentrus adspersus]
MKFIYFVKKLNEKLVSFICKLYAETTFSRKHVQLIIDDVKELLTEPLNIFREYILKTINSDHEIKEKDINHFFFEFENIFSSLDTEYLRFKYLEKSNYFVKPIEYIVGQKPDKISNNKTLPKNYTSQFIHIRDVLKKFFELPNVLSETLQYIAELDKLTVNITNIIQTEFWKEKTVSDLKEFGEDVIFSKAIDECNYLETTGIKVNQNGKEITIYFCLALLLGDNLGLNTILGFAESFRANFYCRFCKCSKDIMQQQGLQNDDSLRNKTNYAIDVTTNNVSLTGIKKDCVWNSVLSFHVTENYSADIAHDIFEGIAMFDIVELLYQYVFISKLFTIDTFNTLLKCFDFGKSNINKPPLISHSNLKSMNRNIGNQKNRPMLYHLVFVKSEGFKNSDLNIETDNPPQNVKLIIPNFDQCCAISKISYEDFKTSYICNKIVTNNTTFKVNDVIVIDQILPMFGIINYILINSCNKAICFVYNELKVVNFNEHFYAFEVSESSAIKCVLHQDVYFFKSY